MKITVNTSGASKKFDRVAALRSRVMKDAYAFFVDTTPVAKKNGGNARRNTRLIDDKIVADYDYAEVLDQGRHMTNRGMRGSTQAPKGMSGPTRQRFGSIIDIHIKEL